MGRPRGAGRCFPLRREAGEAVDADYQELTRQNRRRTCSNPRSYTAERTMDVPDPRPRAAGRTSYLPETTRAPAAPMSSLPDPRSCLASEKPVLPGEASVAPRASASLRRKGVGAAGVKAAKGAQAEAGCEPRTRAPDRQVDRAASDSGPPARLTVQTSRGRGRLLPCPGSGVGVRALSPVDRSRVDGDRSGEPLTHREDGRTDASTLRHHTDNRRATSVIRPIEIVLVDGKCSRPTLLHGECGRYGTQWDSLAWMRASLASHRRWAPSRPFRRRPCRSRSLCFGGVCISCMDVRAQAAPQAQHGPAQARRPGG